MSGIEHEGTEAPDGAYYCPGCGKRFDTPGNCTGPDEAGHAPIAVEKVKATAAKSDTAEKPAAKRRKPAAKRKTAAASK